MLSVLLSYQYVSDFLLQKKPDFLDLLKGAIEKKLQNFKGLRAQAIGNNIYMFPCFLCGAFIFGNA